MNTDSPKNPRQELEASLTALLLGELPPEKAATLRQAIERDAELAKLYERLKLTIELVRETVPSHAEQAGSLKLSEQRRQKLLQHFKTVAPKEFERERQREKSWLVPIGIAAVLVAILAIWAALDVPTLRLMSRVGSEPSQSVVLRSPESAFSETLHALSRKGETAFKGESARNARQRIQNVDASPTFSPPLKPEVDTATVLPSGGKSTDAQHPPAPAPSAITAGLAPAEKGKVGYYSDVNGIGRFDRATGLPVAPDSGVQANVRGDKEVSLTAAPPARALRREIALPSSGELADAAKAPVQTWSFDDSAHLKQGNVLIADGSAQQLSRSKLQEASKNSGNPLSDGYASLATPLTAGDAGGLHQGQQALNGTAPIDPATGLPTGTVAAFPPIDPVTGFPVGPGETSGPSGGGPAKPPLYIGALKEDPNVLSQGLESVVNTTSGTGGGGQGGGGGGGGAVNQNRLGAIEQLSRDGGGTMEKPAENAPALGDLPLAGRLFRSESSGAGAPDKTRDRAELPDTPALGKNLATWAAGESDAQQFGMVTNYQLIGSLPVDAKDATLPLNADNTYNYGRAFNTGTRRPEQESEKKVELAYEDGLASYRLQSQLGVDSAEATRGGRSSIVLPSLQPESTVALNYQNGTPVSPVAAANKPAEPPAIQEAEVRQLTEQQPTPTRALRLPGVQSAGEKIETLDAENTGKSQAYLAKKRELEELQRFRQMLDLKIASENTAISLPKGSLVTIVDKAQPEPRPYPSNSFYGGGAYGGYSSVSAQSPTLWERIRGKFAGGVERHARVKLDRDQSDITGVASDARNTGTYDPYFIQNESEVIQSEAVLGKVVGKLNLNEAWAKKYGDGRKLTTTETIGILKKSLDLRSVPNSSILDIGFKSDKPDEAASIANAVAEAYSDYRLEERTRLSEGSVKALADRLAEQAEKIRKAEAELARLERESNTHEPDVAAPKPPSPTGEPQPEVSVRENPFSTFSLNVSDVSFKLAGASLEKGQMPEPANVRSEEFINAFDYRDPEPPAGVPIAFAWERAAYPFAQNRDLLRFSVKTAALGREPGRPLNLVLLLDNSGSMERADRVNIIREALRVLAGQLQPQDKLSVVTFARTARLWVDGVPGSQAAQVAEEVSGLTPQGGTNLEEAMNLAYQTALRHYLANGVNRVVLLTDGAANLGDVKPESLKQKVETHRKQGIALDCFGIGWEGYNDDLLEVLSRNGDGRYGFINTPEEAANEFASQLAGALHVAASDVKVQVEFNPSRVTAYRQIGYAKHQLTKEQFRDNTVDAAEIGAAESGNALYVIEVNPRGNGPLGMVRVRYKVPGTEEYHEHEWPAPYSGNAISLEQASPAMRLAATASAFSEWLVSSPYAGEVTPDRLLGYLSGVPEVCGADARPKKLEWMIRQAKSLTGK